jgi:hypothetical protein
MQVTAVCALQDDDAQMVAPISAEADGSGLPKLVPHNVIEVPPLSPRLYWRFPKYVSTGASNVNIAGAVDTDVAMVSWIGAALPVPAKFRWLSPGPGVGPGYTRLHTTALDELHDTVPHSVEPRRADTVVSLGAKFVPSMVTDSVALLAVFGIVTTVSTATSNVKPRVVDPICELTVNSTLLATPQPLGVWQRATVGEVHAVVKQTVSVMPTVPVRSTAPKLKPFRRIRWSPVGTALKAAPDVHVGAS